MLNDMDTHTSSTRGASRNPLIPLKALLTALCVPLLLSACRLLIVTEGQGFLVATSSGAIYGPEAVIEIDAAYSESFRPMPHPGHSFAGWGALCRNQPVACPVTIPDSLVGFDVDGALEPRFQPDYNGPLRFTAAFLDASEIPDSGILTIARENLLIEGLASDDAALQVYVANRDLSFVLVGDKTGDNFVFNLTEPGLSYLELELVVSAVDSNGVLTSAALELFSVPAADAADLKAYRSSSPYADVIAGCVSARNAFEVCDFTTLPLVGMETSNPQLDDVLDRVVISHDWMGQRFLEHMQRMPTDMLRMFRGVTAVVISANVRPAYYLRTTGAIHIDPDFLWLRRSEKSTISRLPDFRADFGAELSLVYSAHYLDGSDFGWPFYSLDDNRERTLDDSERPFAWVMFHELAHANDFSPPGRMGALDPSDSMIEAVAKNREYWATSRLEAQSPLNSSLLDELAAIIWGGKEANFAQRQLSARDAGLAFEAQAAVELYGFFTGFEDTATLVDQVMMRHHFGLDYVAAFTDRPALPQFAACDAYIVRWGQRSRIGDPSVAARAASVLETVLDQSDVSSYFNGVPAVSDLVVNTGYCSSLARSESAGSDTVLPRRRPFERPQPLFPFRQLPGIAPPHH